MAIKSKYQLQIHQLVKTEDLSNLSESLQEDFQDICTTVLAQDPYRCLGFLNHPLKGRLKDYRTLEIDFDGVAYRLVYRIYEKPSPKRVFVISFDQHDPAYDKAKERASR
ncbi:MAG: hypothetical protein VKJ02_03095 [Snowella sp.]|nr:hypothetical protein [Snowella sp.]